MRRRRSEKTKQSKKDKQNQSSKRRRLIKNQNQSQEFNQQNDSNICEEKEAQESGKSGKFYGCYLLASLCPRFKGHTYIGYTVNPKRRIRQHNGEITSGAFRTKKKRPWEMVLCIHGFPSNVAALQHPRESIAVREAAASFKTLGGLANKIKLALTMLTLHSWQSMDLRVSFFSTKYMNHVAGCPSLPRQMKLHFCSMDELPCYGNSDLSCGCDDEDDIHSNDNEPSASDSDERLEPSAGESMESDYIPYSFVNSSDEISAVEPIGINGSLEHGSLSTPKPLKKGTSSIVDPFENESFSVTDPLENESFSMTDRLEYGSCSMMDPVEEDLQSLHQLPVDVKGSTRNYLSEHIETPAYCSVQSTDSEFREEIGVEELRSSFSVIEERSSVVGTTSIMEDTAKKDRITCIVIDDTAEELCEPTRILSPFRFIDTVRPYSNKGVEIIELCTPSPGVRITAGSKKKKFASDFPDIIDLTASPSIVEL